MSQELIRSGDGVPRQSLTGSVIRCTCCCPESTHTGPGGHCVEPFCRDEPCTPISERRREQEAQDDTEEDDQLRDKLKAITEATILWRDRTAGDVGLAIALGSILDADKPEPPATAAVARVRKLHHPMRRGALTTCRECSGWDGHRCRGVVTPYPCATISALEGNAT
jgi:hypothetical protein